MASESIAHKAEGRMGYWLRANSGSRNNCKEISLSSSIVGFSISSHCTEFLVPLCSGGTLLKLLISTNKKKNVVNSLNNLGSSLSTKDKMVIVGAAGGGGLLLLILIIVIVVVFRFRRY